MKYLAIIGCIAGVFGVFLLLWYIVYKALTGKQKTDFNYKWKIWP